MSPTDSVEVVQDVGVPPARAFAVFTEHTDRWWRTGPKYRFLSTD